MAEVLDRIVRADCGHVRPSDWRGPDEPKVIWCVHRLDEVEVYVDALPARRSIRKLNAATPALTPLDEIIEASRAILELEPDEDEVQAPYAEETWTRAVEFLRRNAKWVWDTFSRVMDLPEILPGPDGSIDLHWDYPGYEMLINVPADPTNKAGFYGDDRGEIQIKGTFDPGSHNHGLLLWLARAK